jgi:hypothetical protein
VSPVMGTNSSLSCPSIHPTRGNRVGEVVGRLALPEATAETVSPDTATRSLIDVS